MENTSDRRILWGGLVSIAGFFLTALLLFNSSLFASIDSSINALFISIQNSFITEAMVAFEYLSGEVIFSGLVIIAALVFFMKQARIESMLLAIPMFIGGLSVKFFKDYFEVARPTAVVGDVVSSYSFPSGHTTLAFLFFILFGFLMHKGLQKTSRQNAVIWTSSILVAITVFNRLYLGVHWFSDVLAGALLGTGIALISLYIYMRS